ncbi:MAG: hypothetical protein IPF47_22620 [Gemmatimonadetes bacterium]|nr:hypothetical protein [Gemmatimonadota bacterium]
MRDLTQGSIPAHIVRMAAPLAIGMVFQTAYYFIDLYFVGRLGDAAIAGAAAGNLQFIVIASRRCSASTMVLISHAAGRKDRADANPVFNQSVLLAALAAALTLGLGFPCRALTCARSVPTPRRCATAPGVPVRLPPALAMQFALVSMGSALRGSGIAKPMMVVQMLTVVLHRRRSPCPHCRMGDGAPVRRGGCRTREHHLGRGGGRPPLHVLSLVEKSVAFN